MSSNKLLKNIISNISSFKYILCFPCLILIGGFFNNVQPFPDYWFFSVIFGVIFIVAIFAEKCYFKSYDSLLKSIGGNAIFYKAKYHYYMNMQSKRNIVIPAICAIIFTILGLSIYSTKNISITLIIMLLFFSVDIFFCMIGYMQYLYLFKFVYDLGKMNVYQIKNYNDIYPSKTVWIEQLSQICTIYQYVFFGLGSAYIVAFSRLCINPAFGVNLVVNNTILIIEWVIISLLIIVTFPIVSFSEYTIISVIVKKLKKKSVRILDIKYRHSDDNMKLQLSSLIINITDTKNYPLNNTILNIYSIISSFVNAVTALVTILNLYGISNESITKFLM